MPIPILYVIPVGEKGGSERAYLDLFKYHDRRVVSPHVALLKNGPLVQQVRNLVDQTFVVPTVRLRNLVSTVRTVCALSAFIRLHRIQIVNSSHIKAHIYGGLAARIAGCKSVCWHMDYLTGANLIEKVGARIKVDRMIFVSRSTHEISQAVYPKYKDAAVVYPPTDPEVFNGHDTGGLREEFGLPPEIRIVSMIARLQPWKGQRYFIEAIPKIMKAFSPTHFLIVGDALFGLDVEFKTELKELIQALNLESCVTLTGFRNDIPNIVAVSDVVVHASVTPEPFGIIITETMASGKPIIATRPGGPSEIVEDGVSGLLIPPRNAEAIAEAVIHILAQPEVARKMGEAGRKRVLEQFTPQKVVGQIEEIYARLSSHPSGERTIR